MYTVVFYVRPVESRLIIIILVVFLIDVVHYGLPAAKRKTKSIDD